MIPESFILRAKYKIYGKSTWTDTVNLLQEIYENIKLAASHLGYSQDPDMAILEEHLNIFYRKKGKFKLEFTNSFYSKKIREAKEKARKFPYKYLYSVDDLVQKEHFSILKYLRDDIILELKISGKIKYDNQKQVYSIILDLIVIPSVFYKLKQKVKKGEVSYHEYKAIIDNLKLQIEELLDEAIGHLNYKIELEPTPLSVEYADYFLDELEERGFKRTVKELKEVLRLKEEGDNTLALRNLRSALDTFIKEFRYIKFHDRKAFNKQVHISNFLEELKNHRFLTEKEKEDLYILFARSKYKDEKGNVAGSVNSILSDFVHNMDIGYTINKHYVELLYGLVKEFMKFLLKKALYYDVNIKNRK